VIDQSAGVHSFTKYNNGGDDKGIACCGCYSGTHKLAQVVRNGLKGQYEHNEKHNPVNHDHLWQVYWQKTYLNPFSTTGIETGTKKRFSYSRSEKSVHGGTHAGTDHMIKLMQGLGQHKGESYELEPEEFHKVKVGPIKAGAMAYKKVVDKEAVMYSTLAVRNYTLPNIFSYDFVNEDINEKIIAMNTKSLQKLEDE
jgi:hypothetical protein